MKRNKTLFLCAAALLILAGCTTASAEENPFPSENYGINISDRYEEYCHEDHEHGEHCRDGRYDDGNRQYGEHCHNRYDREDNAVQAKSDSINAYESNDYCDRNHDHDEHCHNGSRHSGRRHHKGHCHD